MKYNSTTGLEKKIPGSYDIQVRLSFISSFELL